MNCGAILSRLDDHLDGYLPPIERTAVEAHLRGCRRCSEALVETRELRRQLRELPVPRPDMRGFSRAIAAAAEAENSRRLRRRTGMAGGALAASLVLALGLGLRDDPIAGDPAAGPVPAAMVTQAEHPVPGIHTVSSPAVLPQEEILALIVPLNEEREISLALESQRRIEEATFTVHLPEGLELAGYPGQREISWRGPLESGHNLLILPIRAQAGVGGDLIARIADAERQRSLTLRMEVSEPGPKAPPIIPAAESTLM
ncbi:MAG: zf-HC2 domain-containing protein [Gammaproteobacteria bacterium]|nr:zf-HC2 domain-containing protein [Gammaproteobacteria bacterium]